MIELHEKLQFFTLPQSEGAVLLLRAQRGPAMLCYCRRTERSQLLNASRVGDEFDDFFERFHECGVAACGSFASVHLHDEMDAGPTHGFGV